MTHDWSALLDQETHRMEMCYHPKIGHLHVPNQVIRLPHERGGYYCRTNLQGFRSDVEFEQARVGRPRILFFGDSFTAGQGCDNHERYSECIGRDLDVEVFNYGVSGTAPDQQLLIYEEFASKVEADVIVWGIALHNIERIQMTHRPSRNRVTGRAILMPKPYFSLETGELRLHHVPVPRVRPDLRPEHERGYLDEQVDPGLSVLRSLKGVLRVLGARAEPIKHRLRGLTYRASGLQMYDDYRSSESPGWRLMAALIRRFKESAGATPLLVVPLPTFHYYVDKLEPIYDRLFESLEDRETALHVLSLTRPLVEGKALRERLAYCFPHDSHYSPRGHAAIAQVIGEELRGLGWLPPRSPAEAPPASVEPKSRHVLGIVPSGEGAASLLRDGVVVASAPERLFGRRRGQAAFSHHSANFCLEDARIQQTALAACVFVGAEDRTRRGGTASHESGHSGWQTSRTPHAIRTIGSPHLMEDALQYSGQGYAVPHGLAQCASAFYPSPFDNAAVLSVHEKFDGVLATIAEGTDRDLRVVAEIAGGSALETVAGRLAGLLGLCSDAPMAELAIVAGSAREADVRAVRENLLDFGEDGSFWDPGFDDTRVRAGLNLGKDPPTTGELVGRHRDVAAAFLQVVRECVTLMAEHARRVVGRRELCVVGAPFHDEETYAALEGAGTGLWRQHHTGVVSAAIGAAKLAWHVSLGGERRADTTDAVSVGPAFSSEEIRAFLDTHGFSHEVVDDASVPGLLCELLASGHSVGRFHGPVSQAESWNGRSVLFRADAGGVPDKIRLAGHQPRPLGQDAAQEGLRDIDQDVYWIPLRLPGEAVAVTPFDAYRCMMLGRLDSLLLQGHLVRREEQPPWPDVVSDGDETGDPPRPSGSLIEAIRRRLRRLSRKDDPNIYPFF